MTVPHTDFRVLATVCCVIGASAGASEGFATWVLLTCAAWWSVVTLWAGHAHRPARLETVAAYARYAAAR